MILRAGGAGQLPASQSACPSINPQSKGWIYIYIYIYIERDIDSNDDTVISYKVI